MCRVCILSTLLYSRESWTVYTLVKNNASTASSCHICIPSYESLGRNGCQTRTSKTWQTYQEYLPSSHSTSSLAWARFPHAGWSHAQRHPVERDPGPQDVQCLNLWTDVNVTWSPLTSAWTPGRWQQQSQYLATSCANRYRHRRTQAYSTAVGHEREEEAAAVQPQLQLSRLCVQQLCQGLPLKNRLVQLQSALLHPTHIGLWTGAHSFCIQTDGDKNVVHLKYQLETVHCCLTEHKYWSIPQLFISILGMTLQRTDEADKSSSAESSISCYTEIWSISVKVTLVACRKNLQFFSIRTTLRALKRDCWLSEAQTRKSCGCLKCVCYSAVWQDPCGHKF